VAEPRYLTRSDVEVVAQRLASRLFPESDPAATFALLGGEERGGALLESALALPRQPYYPEICDKAAALMRSLMKNHPFVDGNKRTAVAATLVFLLINRHVLVSTPDQLVEFAVELAGSHPAMELEDISKWLRAHTVSLEGLTGVSLKRVKKAHPNLDVDLLLKALRDVDEGLGDVAEP
jgi:death-on-curing protein